MALGRVMWPLAVFLRVALALGREPAIRCLDSKGGVARAEEERLFPALRWAFQCVGRGTKSLRPAESFS